jgi:hypothetical protein
MGFMLVPWGAAAGDVRAVYGKPLMEQEAEDRTVLIYKEGLAGVPVFSVFYLDKKAGLVKGVSTIPYGTRPDCEKAMHQSIERIQRIYPALQPVEARKHEGAAVPFCEAAEAGNASWSVTWTDPLSRNSVEVLLEPGDRNVVITYLSGAFPGDSTASN